MSKKILVVDDDEGILDALELMLSSSGYEVETSVDGEVLEKLHKDHLPNVILLDVLLSGRDGRELCKLLKNQDSTKQIPIIMISAHPKAEIDVKACGADDFAAKPFEIEDLLVKLESYVK